MIGKRWLLLLWFPTTLIMLIINLSLLLTFARQKNELPKLNAAIPAQSNFQLTSAGGTSQVLNATVIAGDARVLLVQSFLQKYNSPMAPYADLIVQQADQDKIDWKLVPAIAMCESNAGKHMPKKNEFNAFGIAVYTGTKSGKAFTSWSHAIEWVSGYIKDQYYNKGITNLTDIGAIWAPPSIENGYSWTNCVQSFQDQII